MSADDTGDAPAAAPASITFNVKTSADAKYVITVPENITVLDLKQRLATSEYADVPADRQRLIYSGRVLKDPDQLSTYKIKDGNTVHMVKSAASNAMRNPAASSSTSQTTGTTGSNTTSSPEASGVPQNIASGTGHDPLAGLTGARYAGFAQMPGAGMFGPDGGMNPPSQDEMLRMLENPMFAQQMNEAMNNPQTIRMMQDHPMIRNNPMMRQMLENPEFRRMLMDPEMIRMSMRMAGNGGGRGQTNMPAPGATDNTQTRDGGAGSTTGNDNAGSPSTNPFVMFDQLAMGGPARGFSPIPGLFGNNQPPNTQQTTTPSNPSTTSTTTGTTDTPTSTDSANTTQDSQQQPPPNPFGSLFGMPPSQNTQSGQQQQQNPIAQMTQQMMQNPELMRQMMASMGLGGNPSNTTNPSAPQDPNQTQNQNFNPWQDLFNGMGGGFGGAGAFGGGGWGAPPQAPQDTRPPEEQYAEQLRQLNDMGFYEFEANVRALRRSGGSVQGAVEALLNP